MEMRKDDFFIMCFKMCVYMCKMKKNKTPNNKTLSGFPKTVIFYLRLLNPNPLGYHCLDFKDKNPEAEERQAAWNNDELVTKQV